MKSSRFGFFKKHKKHILAAVMLIGLSALFTSSVTAADVDININQESSDTIDVLITLTVLALLPSILIMMTSFTRIIVVLSFLRSALGLQQTPPNQVLIGIALFLTLFVMSPVLTEINNTAYEPYKQEQITRDEFLNNASIPLKKFMLKQTKQQDLKLFFDMNGESLPEGDEQAVIENTPMKVVIPAFITSELKRAFLIGFLLYIPFVVIDMIVASTLMSMGMIMLPPTMISIPFKLILFVLVDGWSLLFKSLVQSFNL